MSDCLYMMTRARVPLIGVAAVALVVLLLAAAVSTCLASAVAMPKGMTLDEETAWEKGHGLWGAFDTYETEAYAVRGKDGYVRAGHAESMEVLGTDGYSAIVQSFLQHAI